MNPRASVAFVTCSTHPELQPDDALAAARLADLGVRAEAAAWNDPEIDWGRFDAIVLRSTWDYHLRTPEFLSWLDARERDGGAFWNPPSIVRWNADKRYLLDLSAAGVAVVPTVHRKMGTSVNLPRLLDDRDWRRAVIKPAISGGAYRTWIVERSAPADSEQCLAELLEVSDVLVQPYLSEIEIEGEWSLIFFDEEFSHAVLKHPAPGDFRVQEEFGGLAEAAEPPAGLVDAARRVLSAAAGSTLYARVDGCRVDGVFELLELEVIEPTLYLSAGTGADLRFAEAIARRLA